MLEPEEWSSVRWIEPFSHIYIATESEAERYSCFRALVLHYLMANAHLDKTWSSKKSLHVDLGKTCRISSRSLPVPLLEGASNPVPHPTNLHFSNIMRSGNHSTPHKKKRSQEDENETVLSITIRGGLNTSSSIGSIMNTGHRASENNHTRVPVRLPEIYSNFSTD